VRITSRGSAHGEGDLAARRFMGVYREQDPLGTCTIFAKDLGSSVGKGGERSERVCHPKLEYFYGSRIRNCYLKVLERVCYSKAAVVSMSELHDDSTDYWRGRYDESVTARRELDELLKQVLDEIRAQQDNKSPGEGGGGNPFTSQMGAIVGAIPPLMMVLFGIYGTGTGADIGIPMIIIGALFALFVVPYLLIKRSGSKEKKGDG
jgi:hypothetical protein